MKLSSKNLMRIAIGIVVVLYCFILFIVKRDVNYPNFWINFTFVMLPFILLFIDTFFKSSNIDNYYLIYPQVKIILGYTLIEFIVGTVLLNFPDLNYKVILLIQIPLLLIVALIFIYFLIPYKHVNNKLQKKKVQKNYLIILRNSINTVYDSVTDSEVKDKLESLLDLIKYSETNTPPSVKMVENKIDDLVDNLLASSDKSEQLSLIKEIEIQLNKRNRLSIGMK